MSPARGPYPALVAACAAIAIVAFACARRRAREPGEFVHLPLPEAYKILDVEGNPIADLFSSGEFGSIHNFMYQGGTNVSECVIFGRIAAKSAFEA